MCRYMVSCLDVLFFVVVAGCDGGFGQPGNDFGWIYIYICNSF